MKSWQKPNARLLPPNKLLVVAAVVVRAAVLVAERENAGLQKLYLLLYFDLFLYI